MHTAILFHLHKPLDHLSCSCRGNTHTHTHERLWSNLHEWCSVWVLSVQWDLKTFYLYIILLKYRYISQLKYLFAAYIRSNQIMGWGEKAIEIRSVETGHLDGVFMHKRAQRLKFLCERNDKVRHPCWYSTTHPDLICGMGSSVWLFWIWCIM